MSFVTRRHFSRSCNLFLPTKSKPIPPFPTSKQRRAQKNFDKTKFPEPREAQARRLPWEYPVGADQRSSWKHRRWYDAYFNRWVNTLPSLEGGYNIFYKEERKLLFEAETPYDFFHLLLDRFVRRKYVIESFNHETPISNISYYHQYLTHTKYVHGMPFCIHNAHVDDDCLSRFREYVSDLLLMQFSNSAYDKETDPLKKAQVIKETCMKSILLYLISAQSSENSNLAGCEVDHDIENSMFWFRGRGFIKWTQAEDLPVAHQCHNKSNLQIRTKEPLPEFTPWMGSFSTSGDIPSFYTTPHVFKTVFRQYRNTITPGYRLFAGDFDQNYQYAKDEDLLHELPPPIYSPCNYGHTQLLMLPETYSREWYEENLEHSDITGEIEEHLKGHGIMSGWVWNAAQAHYAKHWMDNDITKPFCSQNIVTDGKWLSFFCYQLNTLAIDADNIDDNERRNICYGMTSIKLFDEITSDGVVGLNDEALLMLIKFVSNGNHQHELTVKDDDQVEMHNSSLDVQEVNPEMPEIELQKSAYKVERDNKIKAEEQAVKLIEQKNKSLRTKLTDWILK